MEFESTEKLHADAIFSIIKNDLEPLKEAVDFFKKELFGKDNNKEC